MATFLRGEKPERLLIKEKVGFTVSKGEKTTRKNRSSGGGGVMAISSVDMCR